MAEIKIDVQGNRLTAEYDFIPTGNEETVTCVFAFGEGWDGYSKTAIFFQDKNSVQRIVLAAGQTEAAVPWEVLTQEKPLLIGVFGTQDGKRLTTNWATLLLTSGSYDACTAPPPPTPDIYAQILDLVEDYRQDNSVNAERAEIAAGEAGDFALAAEAYAGASQESAASASGSASAAVLSAQTATERASEASGYALSAESFKNDAQTASAAAGNFRDETQNIKNAIDTAEPARVAAESGRVSAESGRAAAESIRVASEESRSSAETNRMLAENIRVQNENARISATAANKVTFSGAVYETYAGGLPAILADAAPVPLAALEITGSSSQSGTPSPAAPVAIVSAADPVVDMGDTGLNPISFAEVLRGTYNGAAAVRTDKIILDGKARTVIHRKAADLISLLNGGNGTWVAYPQFDHTGGEAKCYGYSMSANYASAATPFMLCTHIPYHASPTNTATSTNGCRANESAKLLYFKVRTDTVINGVTIDNLEKWVAAIAYLEGTANPLRALVPTTTAIDTDITDTPSGQALLAMVPNQATTTLAVRANGNNPRVSVTYAKDLSILIGNKANKFNWYKPYPQISPTAQNGWVVDTDSGMGQSTPCYAMKDDMGRAHLYISAKSGTIGQKICTLPTGWRPQTKEYFVAVSNGGFGYGYIASNGDVVPVSGNNASFWAIYSYYPDITL